MNDQNHELLLKNAFCFAAIGMALVGLDGRWLQVNRSLCGLLGYSREELLALTFQDLTHPDDLDGDLRYVDQLLRGEIATYQMEKRYFHKTGQVIWALLEVALVRNDEGAPQVFVSQISDISERKAAEQEMERLLVEKEKRLVELEGLKGELDAFRSQLFSVCAWTKRIFYAGQWMSMELFLQQYLKLNLTHGVCEDAARRIIAEMDANDEDERQGTVS